MASGELIVQSSSSTLDVQPTHVAPKVIQIGTGRKYVLLALFCLAQFLDTFNQGAIYSAIPSIKEALDMNESEPAWLVSAFGLTFASFLLVGGRMSDVYNPKAVFMIGLVGLGLVSLGAGFLNAKIPLLVLRAIAGILAAMTIPSSLALLVIIFPEPTEQSVALAIFGGVGAVGNILGLVIGAVFSQLASWRWVFWFITVVAIPLALICGILIPAFPGAARGRSTKERFQKLDIIGVGLFTIVLVLFIFALTSATDEGWGTAYVLCPLIISVFLLGCALWWEAITPFERAAVPPRTWFYPNFSVLFALSLVPYFWWNTNFTVLNLYWQQVFNWTPINCAVHTIPSGVLAVLVSFSAGLTKRIETKWILLTAHVFLGVGSILFTFADRPDRYWSFVFPGYVIGSAGSMLVFMHVNIAIFRTTPAKMSGVVGALFNSGLQVGTSVGLAAFTAIETGIEGDDGSTGFKGRRAGFWFMFGVIAVEALALIIFYRTGMESYREEDENISNSVTTNEKIAVEKSAAEAGAPLTA